MKSNYYPAALYEEAWFYINTHFLGAKFIANECGMKIRELREYVFSWDGKDSLFGEVLHIAGGELKPDFQGDLYIEPSTHKCNDSFRYCKRGVKRDKLLDFLSEGAIDDTCYGDFCCIESVNERVFVFVHKQHAFTSVIEIDEKWKSLRKIASLLECDLLGYQGVSVLSPLSLSILSGFISELDKVKSEKGYIIAINHLHNWANLFDYRYQFAKHKFETEPDFFFFTDEYDDKFEYPAKFE